MEAAREPLEGTPLVFNTLAQHLGLDTDRWHFVDVLGLDDQVLLLTIPDEECAGSLILLYPTSVDRSRTTTSRIDEQEKAKDTATAESSLSSSLFYLKQVVGGTCGTLAVAHAVANSGASRSDDALKADSPLSPKSDCSLWKVQQLGERSRRFIADETVRRAHRQASTTSLRSSGNEQQEPPQAGIRQGRHFLALVQDDEGRLWELDGRGPPVCLRGRSGNTTAASSATTTTTAGPPAAVVFLREAVARVKEILAVMSPAQQLDCSLVALVRRS